MEQNRRKKTREASLLAADQTLLNRSEFNTRISRADSPTSTGYGHVSVFDKPMRALPLAVEHTIDGATTRINKA
ncbi:unnamed protein product [Amoebophrya sp. A25]|nr:unnamed protein product [Amoebophrya sp. A25]|eukprot:GSA25T00008552001.1